MRHIDFKFLLKADDDTFVCVERLANFLHNQPEGNKDKLYAGVPTSCNAPSNPRRNVRGGRGSERETQRKREGQESVTGCSLLTYSRQSWRRRSM